MEGVVGAQTVLQDSFRQVRVNRLVAEVDLGAGDFTGGRTGSGAWMYVESCG